VTKSTFDRVLFSTGKDDWETPPELFAALDAEFGFTVDAAATCDNTYCPMWFGLDSVPGGYAYDALTTDWSLYGGPFWCNPPYSRGLQGKFIAKAAAERLRGCTTVMLLPARTDTKAFHEHIWDRERHQPRHGVQVRFLKGRLRFVGAPASAPFPSMIVVFAREQPTL
jgi:phage N-6-adenine-methyltransferase